MAATDDPGQGRLRLRFAASAAGLAEAQPALRTFLDAAGLAPGLADRAELLVEELAMNVAMHGFDASDDPQVDLEASTEEGACILVFEDGGRAFDPTAGALPDRPTSLAEAEPGGLGLVLLRRMASDLRYERLPEGRNRLWLRIVAAPRA